MREIRLALLEADVNFEVVKGFVSQVRERALGQDVLKSLTPGQQGPAAIDQLEQLGKQVQVPVHREDGTDPVTVVRNGIRALAEGGADTVILDTAGRLHVDADLMAELELVRDEAKPTNVLLVV